MSAGFPPGVFGFFGGGGVRTPVSFHTCTVGKNTKVVSFFLDWRFSDGKSYTRCIFSSLVWALKNTLKFQMKETVQRSTTAKNNWHCGCATGSVLQVE